jgi:hypothetical protein
VQFLTPIVTNRTRVSNSRCNPCPHWVSGGWPHADEPCCHLCPERLADPKRPELYNLGLSVKRADSASKYLSNKGISGDRITNKFYGFEVLAASCNNDPKCIEAAQRENRRVEIRVLIP